MCLGHFEEARRATDDSPDSEDASAYADSVGTYDLVRDYGG
jgi:hypothetical protein